MYFNDYAFNGKFKCTIKLFEFTLFFINNIHTRIVRVLHDNNFKFINFIT